MISLFPFQTDASTTIFKRYQAFITDPERPRKRGFGPVPFYQSLHALTGSGKTPILADAVSLMRTVHPVEPIILWISKATVVIEQTLANFLDGGKYNHLIDHFVATALRDCTPSNIEDASVGLILLGTVATFNSKERGDRLIFGVQMDKGGLSLWDTLIQRRTVTGVKRPLIIVYDEGHNLTNQQADLLLELRPEAIIVASATPRMPDKIVEIIDFLKLNGYSDAQLRTPVQSSAVVDAELVKREVRLGGYVTSEEVAISAMIEDYRDLATTAAQLGLSFSPKCIYVCKTNIKGDEIKPFSARNAPPIRIWRYLVERCGVDPSKIAVYCDLKVSKAQPLPDEFVLFTGGVSDYAKFIVGNYTHIIFNLGLQEGWDDPECYFAYIDKSMGSELQVEQIVGRVLRQPGTQYYPDPRLNTCFFYIHVDAAGVFADILKSVQQKLAHDMPAVEVISTGGVNRTIEYQEPRTKAELPAVGLMMADAAEVVADVLNKVEDYKDSPDALATGKVAQVVQKIGQGDSVGEIDWVDKGQGMPVTVQWLLSRAISRQYPQARAICDLNEDERYSRTVHLGSRAAANLETLANEVVTTFLQHVSLGIVPADRILVGKCSVDVNRNHEFHNSLHPAYSGLRDNETACAEAIDKLGWLWCRNPSNGGYSLPLLQPGTKRNFFPDFIIWTDKAIWLVDPKGEHLIQSEAGRKLVAIEAVPGELPLRVCLITTGTWDNTYNQRGSDGVTAWRVRGGVVNNPEKFASLDKLLKKVVGAKSATSE